MITIEQAQVSQASDIARLIMEAMNYECCLYFAGEEHGLSGFHQLMTDLVCRTDIATSTRLWPSTLNAMWLAFARLTTVQSCINGVRPLCKVA